MSPGSLLFIAAVGLATGVVLGRHARLWIFVTVASCLGILAAASDALIHDRVWEWRAPLEIGGEAVAVRLDAVSAYFLALLAFVGGAAAIYSRGYWSDESYPRTAGRNRQWWSAVLATMAGVLLSANGLLFLVAWELMALASFFLIRLDPTQPASRSAGWLYLVASHAGTLCLFAFFTALAVGTGSWQLGPWLDRPELAPLFWLALAGFGVKAGLFPLHIWLPSAHANAPSHVSAILSGVGLKLGIYGIVRFSGWLPLPTGAGAAVLSIGAVSALVGIAFALAQTDFKRMLAYSSVENIGIILIGIGAGLLGVQHPTATWTRVAFAGAMLHVWNHGVFKSLLFFGAGSVLHATGTREMSRLGGLWRAMPWTTALFALGSLAVCALPPLNGFVSEWLIYRGLFEGAASRTTGAAIALPAAIVLATTGALALATFIKGGAMTFLGAPRSAAARHAHEAGGWMRGPMLIAAAAAVMLALAPASIAPVLTHVSSAWRSGASADLGPTGLISVGTVQITIALLLITSITVLWRRAHAQPAGSGPTWDCGYALPTARMQYTSGSFGGIAAGWFRWILLPASELRRPRGVFPRAAYWAERTPETVLERVLQPVARVVLGAAAVVRWLQHGRLQFYVAYVAAGVVTLAMLAILGGKP